MTSDRPADRLSSLDQFRGYTVLGMVFVNFIGGAVAIPATFKHHHTYCSFADTIMPQFLFAVGMAYRLTLLRRLQQGRPREALWRAVKRNLGLILLGVVLYKLGGQYRTWDELTRSDTGSFLERTFKRTPFEALVHIGVTALWALPVILAPGWVRVLFAVASGGLHVYLSSAGYYVWNMTPPVGIDGGPLGFLTWTVPLIAGTLAYDLVARSGVGTAGLLGWAVALMTVGYGLSCLGMHEPPHAPTEPGWSPLAAPPFVPPANPELKNYWMMSQRAGSVSYTTFAAGFALAVYALFRVVCDRYGRRWGYLELFGRQALAAYVVHGLVDGLVGPFLPKDAPLWYVLAAFGVYLALITIILRYFDRNGIVFRL
jgi:predicted acyltransferase